MQQPVGHHHTSAYIMLRHYGSEVPHFHTTALTQPRNSISIAFVKPLFDCFYLFWWKSLRKSLNVPSHTSLCSETPDDRIPYDLHQPGFLKPASFFFFPFIFHLPSPFMKIIKKPSLFSSPTRFSSSRPRMIGGFAAKRMRPNASLRR